MIYTVGMAGEPELVSYIAQQTRSGLAAVDLRTSLMEAGWSEEEIGNALHDVAAGMEPLTTGVALHEDLAQVRGVVAHLASRIRVLEGRLASTGLLTMPEALPELPELPVPSKQTPMMSAPLAHTSLPRRWPTRYLILARTAVGVVVSIMVTSIAISGFQEHIMTTSLTITLEVLVLVGTWVLWRWIGRLASR